MFIPQGTIAPNRRDDLTNLNECLVMEITVKK